MNELVAKLELLQADCFVLNLKFHNYHWNVSGAGFYKAHEILEKAYEKMQDLFDLFAERLVQLEHKPLVDPKVMVEKSNIKGTSKEKFSVHEAYTALYEDYKALLKDFHELRKAAIDVDDCSTIQIVEEQILELEKEIWMARVSAS